MTRSSMCWQNGQRNLGYLEWVEWFMGIGMNPVVALKSSLVIIKPLPIEGQTLTQYHLLNHHKIDF